MTTTGGAPATSREDRDELLDRVDLAALLVELSGIDARGQQYPCPNPGHEQSGGTPPATIAGRLWKCHACDEGGSAIDAVMLAQGCEVREAFSWLRRFTNSPDDERGAQRPPARPPEAIPDEEQVRAWADHLQSSGKLLKRLAEMKGWTPAALLSLGVGWDGHRVRLPVRDADGRLANVLGYLPNGSPKMLALRGRSRDLFPSPETFALDAPVWLVEGEPDAISLASLGVPAVAVPGAGGWRSEYASRFAGRDVVVCFDCDAAGRKLVAVVEAALASITNSLRVIDLDAGRDDGYDVGDLIHEATTDGSDALVGVRRLLKEMADVTECRSADTPDASTAVIAPAEPGTLRIVNAADVRVEQVQFLETDRVPLGAVTLVVGDPGLGKSTWTCLLAARTSVGANGTAGPVLMANAEDSPAHVIVPRLAAAGAALENVEFFDVAVGVDEGRPFSLPEDVPALELRARSVGARLVIIDPFAAFLTDTVNTRSDHHVRRALAPLAAMAHRTGIAVVVVAHLNKSAGADPLYRVGGSIGIVGGARSVLLFTRDPDDPDGEQGDRRALGHIKSNWGKLASTLVYRHEQQTVTAGGNTVETHRLCPEGESDVDGRSLLGADADEPPATKAARANEVLAAVLGDGAWHPSSDVRNTAQHAGVASRTLQRAAKDAGVEREDRGFPAVGFWRLPTVVPQSRQAAGATVAPSSWRDYETPVNTGRLDVFAPQSRHLSQNGATGPEAPLADPAVAELLAAFPGSEFVDARGLPEHDPCCPYPEQHAGRAWRSDGGRLVCEVCHPQAIATGPEAAR
jgi:hypothetical protein